MSLQSVGFRYEGPSVQREVLSLLYESGPLDGSQIISTTCIGEEDFLSAIRMLETVGAVRRATREEAGRGKHVEENPFLHVWEVVLYKKTFAKKKKNATP